MRVLIVSNEHGFSHLMRTLLEDLNVNVRCSPLTAAAVSFAERIRPGLVILDLIPGQETASWLILEALKARAATRQTPILLCPAAPWLAEEHVGRLATHGVATWTDAFDLRDLLGKVQHAFEVQSLVTNTA